MADENQGPVNEEDLSDTGESTDDDAGVDAADGGQTEADGGSGEDVADSADSADSPHEEPYQRYSIRASNMGVIGTVTLHGPSRDVHLLMDGESALRLLKCFEQRSDRGYADYLDIDRSSARNGWLVIDLDEFDAMSWRPGTAKKGPRTVIDPLVEAA
jgi:hypothetical protein